MMKRVAAATLFALAVPGGALAVDRTSPEAIFGRALATVAAIGDAKDRAQALQNIALAQAEWGDAQAALLTARSIEDPAIAVATLAGVAALQDTIGHSAAAAATLREANTAALAIADAKERSAALAVIASEQVKAGELAGAQATAMAIADAADRARLFDEIAIARAEAADFKGALATANGIEDAGRRAAALREIAALQAGAGDWDGALATATAIEQAYWRAWALRDIAAVHVELGNRTMAKAILDAALAAARFNADDEERAEALALVAAAQADAGDATTAVATYREALNTAMAVSDAGTRAAALTRIAEVQAEAGAIEDALATADAIEDVGERTRALRDIAAAQAGNRGADVDDFMEHLKAALSSMGRRAGPEPSALPTDRAGDVKGALRTASMIEDPGDRLGALALIADQCIVTGDRAALLGPIRAALATVQADGGFSYVLPFVVLVQVVARDIEGARATAKEFDPQPEVLAFIAWGQAAMGDRAGSEEALRDAIAKAEEADPKWDDDFLRFVALTQARLGDVRAALSTVDRMASPRHRAETLADIAAARSPFAALR